MNRARGPTTMLAMTDQYLETMRELHSRHRDGVHVRLLWHEADNRVAVSVVDANTGDAVAVEVGLQDNALDVFNHPYTYAASRGIETHCLVAA
jgi:hypothetical protein